MEKNPEEVRREIREASVFLALEPQQSPRPTDPLQDGESQHYSHRETEAAPEIERYRVINEWMNLFSSFG